MAIIQAAVGDNLKDFDERSSLDEVWAFVDRHMAMTNVQRPIVLLDDGGATIGELWDASLYQAHWETPGKMRAYLDLIGFDQSN